MTSPPHLECWGFDYLFWRDSIAANNLLHSVQGAIQEKSLGILDSDYLRVFCPSYAITAPVTGHVLWIEGSFWRYRNEVSPGEVTSPSLTNANLTLSSSFIILNNSAKPSSIPCCTEHENLPFPLVKRCQEFLGVHGRTSVFRQKRNSNSSRNGSGSLLVLTLVQVCFKNSKLNSLKYSLSFCWRTESYFKIYGGLPSNYSFTGCVRQVFLFFSLSLFATEGLSGKSNGRWGSSRNEWKIKWLLGVWGHIKLMLEGTCNTRFVSEAMNKFKEIIYFIFAYAE